LKLVRVQHHLAHVLSCMAENHLRPPVLGISWDGTGYGLDGTIWGGEFFVVTDGGWERVARLRPFALPGGERAVKEPRRAALGVLFQVMGAGAFEEKELPTLRAFSGAELAGLRSMLAGRVHSPLTSSAGRLFDAIASLAGLRQRVRFEAQAAMELEFALEGIQSEETYDFCLEPAVSPGIKSGQESSDPWSAASPRLLTVDWAPLVREIIAEVKGGVGPGAISARFHNTMAQVMVEVAGRMGQERVVLSGGCFQNRYLAEGAVRRLRTAGFRPYWHQRVPPNDGGIALGQVVAALRAG
jgi:hydrogenase maturation protein HypF